MWSPEPLPKESPSWFTQTSSNLLPASKPFKTRLQQFSSSGRETAMFRVVYCFSSYREVHTALRSMVNTWPRRPRGIPSPRPTSDPPVKRKATLSSVACAKAQTMSLSTALEKHQPGLLRPQAHDRVWRESIDFTPVLNAVISHVEQVPSFQDPSRHPTLPFSKAGSDNSCGSL